MKTFLICHLGALGDFILTWPAIKSLRQKFSDYHFWGVGRNSYMKLGVRMGLIDSYLDIDSKPMPDFFSGKSLPTALGTPAGAVLWMKEAQSLLKLLQASATLPTINIDPIPNVNKHVARYYCEKLEVPFKINVPKDLSHLFPSRHENNGHILIHPGSGSPKKNFSPQFYLKLADILTSQGYSKIIFLLGPVEMESNIKASFRDREYREIDDLQHLQNLLVEAALYIGNDSGVSHFSGILGTPTIAIYRSTDPEIWGVIGDKVFNIKARSESMALKSVLEIIPTLNIVIHH